MARVRPEQLGWYLSNDLSITGSISESVIISGSNPLTLIGVENDLSASYNLTYDPTTGLVSYGIASSGSGGAGFPFSGSAVITGSLLISGSNPFTVLGVSENSSSGYFITYNTSSGQFTYAPISAFFIIGVISGPLNSIPRF